MKNQHINTWGFAGRLARTFVDSKLTPLVILASLLLGLLATVMLPREEEPQIKVPMVDVLVNMPGATPREVEQRLTIPMEKLLYELPGVEYIYSTSMSGRSMLVVRFYVGENLEDSLIRLNQKLETNFDRIPHTVTPPIIKPSTIDDVPIMAVTLHSEKYNHYQLRRVAAELDDSLKSIKEVAETKIIGGNKRQLSIHIDPLALAARNITLAELTPKIQGVNNQSHSGTLGSFNQTVSLQTGNFLTTKQDVEKIVVGVYGGKPVYLSEVAKIHDGPEEPSTYVLYGEKNSDTLHSAVTLSIAKRPGANAVDVVNNIQQKIDALSPRLIPDGIEISITRDYGFTAAEKSNELLLHMGIAIFGVALLILFFLGWRESIVVMLAIPSTLALTLLVFYLYGYTLNRITLFALIFSIGILVDDAIVVVENIVRHMRLPDNRGKSKKDIAIEAVSEVGNPTILATLAVIAAILPMAFVGGLMGPYMRPIPIGSSAAMFFSLLIAFSVTPWAAVHILKGNGHKNDTSHQNGHDDVPDDWFTRLYHKIMDPLLTKGSVRFIFFAFITLLLAGACSLVISGGVKVKMLPFDNKSEFQVILDMKEGTPLEQTANAALEMAAVIEKDPAVLDYQIYTGTASPHNFNGLVRHYFMRQGDHLADIQVNLEEKHDRSEQSHDIAVRMRPALTKIAEKYGASLVVAEVPPGPPVLQTLVAEIYGPTEQDRLELAASVKQIMENTEGVVDVDWFREEPRKKLVITVDKEKSALNNITEQQINKSIQTGVYGFSFDLFHLEKEKEPVNMVIMLPREQRARIDSVLNMYLRSNNPTSPKLVPLSELVHVEEKDVEQPIYRKNLKPVIYVTGDVANEIESPVYAIFEMNKKLREISLSNSTEKGVKIYNMSQPFTEKQSVLKWDGEWHITLEVFRDLGLAFCVVMILIYMLMVGWFKNYITPLIVMAAIPFSLIGILPAHMAMGAFFSATSMIGFMAGAGIVVRNSIILVDFIEQRIKEGETLAKAVVDAGAIRFRPMLLTALAVVVGASVILADPIFQGLAISLMFGEIASLLVSRMAVPVMYYMVKK